MVRQQQTSARRHCKLSPLPCLLLALVFSWNSSFVAALSPTAGLDASLVSVLAAQGTEYIASPSTNGSAFGFALDVSGDGLYMATSAPFERPWPVVYVHFWNTTAWEVQARLKPGGNNETKDEYGQSVSLDFFGETLAVGRPRESGIGEVWIYKRMNSESGPTWVRKQILKPSGVPSGPSRKSFGRAVKLDQSGSTCVVGMPFYLQGQLQLFGLNSTRNTWEFNRVLNVSTTGTTTGVLYLGESIAMTPDANIIAAGAPGSFGYLVVWNASSDYSYLATAGTYNGGIFSTLAISGDGRYILAGAPEHGYSPMLARGAVAMYYRSPSNYYMHVGQIPTPVLHENETFGSSVAMNSDGTFLVVGAKYWAERTNDMPQGFGSAYFYSRPTPSTLPSDWSLEFNLTYLGNYTGASGMIAYGFSVACSESCDTVAVSAPVDDTVTPFGGSVSVFKSDSSWEPWTYSPTLTPTNIPTIAPTTTIAPTKIASTNYVDLWSPKPQSNAKYGYAVSISGDGRTLAISSPDAKANGMTAGNVLVYTYQGGAMPWVLAQNLTMFSAGTYSGFGSAVGLSTNGSRMVVGAHSSRGANIYTRTTSTLQPWQLEATLKPSDAAEYFGTATAIRRDGAMAVVGAAPYNSVSATNGQAWVYERLANSTWVKRATLVDSTTYGTGTFAYYGGSVALSDNKVVAVGARGGQISSVTQGYVCIHRLNATTNAWSTCTRVTPMSTRSASEFGTSVALSADGTLLAVGAPSYSNVSTAAYTHGAVFVFGYANNQWSQLQVLLGTSRFDKFGRTVALSKDGIYLTVAQRNAADTAAAVYVYKLIASTYTWVKTLNDWDGTSYTSYGFSLTVSNNGSTVAVGAPNKPTHTATYGAGEVVVYRDVQGWSDTTTATPTRSPTLAPTPAPLPFCGSSYSVTLTNSSSLHKTLAAWSYLSCRGRILLNAPTFYLGQQAYVFTGTGVNITIMAHPSMASRVVVRGNSSFHGVAIRVLDSATLYATQVDFNGATQGFLGVQNKAAAYLTDCRFRNVVDKNVTTTTYPAWRTAVAVIGGTLKCRSCVFQDNRIVDYVGTGEGQGEHWGSAIMVYNGSLSLYGCTFKNNTRVPAETGNHICGGAVSVKMSSAWIANSQFIGNSIVSMDSDIQGGALCAYRGSKLRVETCSFSDNYVSTNSTTNVPSGGSFDNPTLGGALACKESLCKISGTRFQRNSASHPRAFVGGGAVMSYKSAINFTDSTFHENRVRASTNSTVGGGALVTFNSSAELHRCVFGKNTVENALGAALAVVWGGKATIMQGNFSRPVGNVRPFDVYVSPESTLDCIVAAYGMASATGVRNGVCRFPSIAPTTSPTMAPTPYLHYPRVYPDVVTISSTGVELDVRMASAGYLYCAAFPATQPPPSSTAVKTSLTTASTYISASNANVTLTLSNLMALSNYSAYCYTESADTPPALMPDYAIALTSLNFTTICCHAVTAPTLPTDLYAKATSPALTFTAALVGRVNVTIASAHYSTLTTAGSCTEAAILAAGAGNTTRALTIRPSASVSFYKSTTGSVTIFAKVSGCYYVSYAVEGPRASEYKAPAAVPFFVYEPGSPQPGPLLSSVRFASTGSTLEAALSGSSDKAGLPGSFACSRLVLFNGVASSFCAWSSPSLLLVTLDSSASVLPGDSFTLLGSLLKAECTATNGNCTAWAYTSQQSATILSPTTPLVPTMQAVYSRRIGACSDLVIDASSTAGSGGRPLTYRWAAASSTGNDLINVTSYLNNTANVGAGLRVISIPGSFLRAGTYQLYVSLLNFLGSRATSSALTVTVSGTAMPTIRLLPSTITIFRSQAVSLFAAVTVPSCSGATTYRFRWRESSGRVASSTADPRSWRVAGGTLTAGTTYTVRVNVTDSQNQSNSASATIVVQRSPLSVSIRGGDRALPAARSLTLDASSSLDPDRPLLGAAGLNYTWACIRGGSLYGSDCGLGALSRSAVVSLGTLVAGTYIFSLTGRTFDGRSASASVTVTAVAFEPPYASLNSLAGDNAKVNPAAKFFLSATIWDGRTAGNLSWAWTLEAGTLSGGASLQSIASTGTSGVYLLSPTVTGSFPFSLVLPPFALLSKASYRLRLTALSPAGNGRAELAFTTNGAPTSGSLAVSPVVGQPLFTGFTFTSANWVDDADDYPLSYTFLYKLGPETTAGLVERALVMDTYASTQSGLLLPEGWGSNYNMTAVVYVKDKYGASARVYQGFNVRPLSQSITAMASNISTLLQSAVKRFNVEAVYQIVSASTTGLSSSSSGCTDAAACTSLRSTLLDYVSSAVALQDSSQSVLLQQAQALQSITSDTATLSPASQALAVDLVTSVTSRGSLTGLDEQGMVSMTGTIDSLLQTSIVKNVSAAEAISASLSSMVRASLVNLEPGEDALSISTSSVNMSNAIFYAATLTNKTLSPPGTNNSVVLPPGGAAGFYSGVESTDEISTAVMSIKKLKKDKRGKNSTSHVLRFSITTGRGSSARRLSAGESDSVSTNLKTNSPQTYSNEGYSGSLNCTRGERDLKSHDCPNGQRFELKCNGTVAHRRFECRSGNRSACGVWDEAQQTYVTSTCRVMRSSPDETRCECRQLASYDSSVSPSELFVDIVALSEQVFGSFLSVLRNRKGWTMAEVVQNIFVFITIGVILQGGAILCFLGYRKDVADHKKRMAEAAEAAEQALHGVVDPALNAEENKLLLNSLPEFVKKRDYWELLVSEMGRRHDYFSIVMVYSRVYSRAYRVALIITMTLTLMFTNALLYDVAYPNMYCEAIQDEFDCLNKYSPMNPGQGACVYNLDTETCSSADLEANFYSQIVIAVVSTIFTGPLNLLLKLIFERAILPPVKDEALLAYEKQKRDAERAVRKPVTCGSLLSLFYGPKKAHAKVYAMMEDDAAAPPGSPSAQPMAPDSPHAHMSIPPMSPVERVKGQLFELKKHREEAQVKKAEEKRMVKQMIESEGGKVMTRVGQQRQELQDVIRMLTEHQARVAASGPPASQEEDQQRKRLASWVERLRVFSREFDDRWNLDQSGLLKPDSKWAKLTGRTYMWRLERRLKEEIFMARRMEVMLSRMPEDEREIRLMEFQRIDFLSRAERKIYLRNQIEFKKDRNPRPVHLYGKMMGWLALVLINLFFGAFILQFGMLRGAATTNSWLSSFIISTLQDPLINLPFLIVFYHVWLPMLIKHKIKAKIDGARSEPYVFKAFIPTGPACRVALQHPEWVSARIVQKTLVSRPSEGPEDSSVSEGQMAAQGGQFQAHFQEHAMEYFTQTEATRQAAGLCIVFSLTSVYVFLALPERFQDMITQEVMACLSGAALFGYALLESVEPAACYGALAATLVVILAALAWHYYRHTHKSLPSLDVLLGLTPPPQKVDGPSTQGKALLKLEQSPLVAQVEPPSQESFKPLAFIKALQPDLELEPAPPLSVAANAVQNPLVLNHTGSTASTGGVDADFNPLDDDGRLDYNNIHSALAIIKNKRAAKHADKPPQRRSHSGGSEGSPVQGEGSGVASPGGGGRALGGPTSSGAEDLDKEADDVDAMAIGQAVRSIRTKTHRAKKSLAAGDGAAASPSAQA